MKSIKKVAFHSLVGEGTKLQIRDALSDTFVVVESDDYDYYFAMETIYSSHEAFSEFLSSKQDAIRFFCCGEALYPDMNLFDYALSTSLKDTNSRILFQPLLLTEVGYLFEDVKALDDSKLNISSESILADKSRFCNFMYSNPRAHVMRDRLFYAISEYKRVDSLGRHLKNTDIVDTRFDDDWIKKSVEIKKPYKFTIAAENAYFPGYITEKLFTSMMANSIPIYFGHSSVGDFYNKDSFIYIDVNDSVDTLVKRVAEIDNDNALYCSIMDQPWRTDSQIRQYYEDIDKYKQDLNEIFSMDISKAKQRPSGTWADNIYPGFFEKLGELQTRNYKGYLRDTANKLVSAFKGNK